MNAVRLASITLLAAFVCACSNNKSSSSSQASAAPGNGAAVFAANCAACHGASGQGSPGVFPPLAANPVVTGDPKAVIHIVKYGLTTAITVGGKAYHGMMPAWSPQIADADIAAVLTYVRSSWGNNAPPIAAADVSAVSK